MTASFNWDDYEDVEPSGFDWNNYEDVQEEPQEEENYFKQAAKEVPAQFAKESAVGFGGTYGDILDMLGIQSKEILPGEQAQYEREANATDEELINLVEGDDVLPRYSRLPNSAQVREILEDLGAQKEAKTIFGKTAARGGKLFGSSAAFGSPLRPKALAGASAAGQGLEEVGAPHWVQALGEIAATLKLTPTNVPITSKTAIVEAELEKLKNLGFSKEDLTLAKNALEKHGVIEATAKLTKNAKEQFKSTLKNSDEAFENILNESFPGLEKGAEKYAQNAGEFYSGVSKLASEVPISNVRIFNNKVDEAIKLLEKIPAVGGRKEALEYLQKGKELAANAKTGDFFTEYYRGLGELGNWANPQTKEAILTLVKDGVKDTLASNGSKGYEYAQMFDQANKVYSKFKQAEDLVNMFKPALTESGADFKKLSTIVDKPQNYEKMVETLGKSQAENLKTIANSGKAIAAMEKSIKGGLGKELKSYGKLGAMAYAAVTMDAATIAVLLGEQAASRYATRMLTDPRTQNLVLKIGEAIKNSKLEQATIHMANLEKALEKD